MVKHAKTILLLLPTNCLSVFGHFVGLALNEFENKPMFYVVRRVTSFNLRVEPSRRNYLKLDYAKMLYTTLVNNKCTGL